MITAAYLEQLKAVHASREWGASGYSHALTVAKYAGKLSAQTVLDFGCGRATLKPELFKIDPYLDVFEYDPAIAGKDEDPAPADLLVANDVLEHIEPQYLDATLARLRGLAIKGAYFTIALTPSKVSLPDGRNAHLIIKDQYFWLAKLESAGFVIADAKMKKGLWVWAK